MRDEVGAVDVGTGVLPRWASVLAVVAHPDDESFGLGAVLDAFVRSGSAASVLCFTLGEASTIHGVSGDLSQLRSTELRVAAEALGLEHAELLRHIDRALSGTPQVELEAGVIDAAKRFGAEGLVVFDPSGVSGHPDHAAASAAAVAAAGSLGLPVLGWTIPRGVAEQLNEEFDGTFRGHEASEIDLVVPVERDRQLVASLAHASQAVPSSVLWRRLELLGEVEHLRWLSQGSATAAAPAQAQAQAQADAAGDMSTMQVIRREDDRFDIARPGQ